MASLTGYGITVDVPAGWDARIYARDGDDGDGDGTARAAMHAATFPLPDGRGDFGSGAVETMGRADVFVVLLEYDRSRADQALFTARCGPAPLDPGSFSPAALQRARPGQAGAQSFFAASGRAFCLYAVIGRFADRDRLAAVVNQLVRTVRIEIA